MNVVFKCMISLHSSILGHCNKGFMAKRHQILFLAVVLSCDMFLESEAASALDVNIKVNVNGKTVIDESYTEGKFVIYGLLILCRGKTSDHRRL